MKKSVNSYPKISIIVVNTNELHHLKICLPSLSCIAYPNYEVLVIDNVSTDGSLEYIDEFFPAIRVITNEKNLGYAGANNVGFKSATGELIAVLNPDTRVDPHWLSEIVCHMEDPKIGLATPKILLMDRPDRINTCGNEVTYSGLAFCRGLDQTKDNFPHPEIVSSVSGAAFVIKKSVLDQIGGFDERFFIYYEETDLSLRAALAGYHCLYVPTSIIYHKYTFKFTPSKAFYQERNRYFSLIKTFRWRTILALLPSLLVAELVAWVYVILNGPQHIRNKFRTYVWLVANRTLVATERQRVQALRRVSDRVILENFGYRLNFTFTAHPQVARLLDVIVNPILYLFSCFSKLIIAW